MALNEYTAEILRGWPNGQALEDTRIIKQGSILVNGDVVEPQPDGTVDKVSATTNANVGLVIRGNGDSASAANANGSFMTPQPAKTITAASWSGGVLSLTVAGHGYVVGNTVTVAGATTTAINGAYTITGVTSSSVFTVALASNPGAITVGSATAQLTSAYNNSGKAVILWGNYIVRTTNFTAGSWVPNALVTASNGKFTLANGTTDPVIGFVIRAQAATANNSNTVTIVVR